MLASETQQIADFLKRAVQERSAIENENTANPFADTKDTLCYATNDNQTAVAAMLGTTADLALVVGGYNSSNTSHLVELCEPQLPTYFVEGPDKLISDKEILHFDLHDHEEKLSTHWLTGETPLRILITSGASCPDAIVEAVIDRLSSFVAGCRNFGEMVIQPA